MRSFCTGQLIRSANLLLGIYRNFRWSTGSLKTFCFSVLTGFLFLGTLFLSLKTIDTNWYLARDDGVITLSSAKNLVDYGFIGVNPSGPVVNASSSPLQTFIYAGVYAVFGAGYFLYSTVQTYLSFFIIGVIFSFFFRERPFVGLFVSTLSAVTLSFIPPFFEWHASGMENALTNLAYLGAVFLLYEMYTREKVRYVFIVPVFLAAIARFESIYYIAPILSIFSVIWLFSYKDKRGVLFSFSVLLLWISFFLWHYLYFGQATPNTANAQGISPIERVWWIVELDWQRLYGEYQVAKEIFFKLAVWLIIPFIPIGISALKKKNSRFLTTLLVTLILCGLFYPFIFGPARIEHVRTVSHTSLLTVLLIASWVYYAEWPGKNVVCALAVAQLSMVISTDFVPESHYLGWSTRGFNETRQEFEDMARKNDLERPIVANPDLGVMSWHKQFNIVDLGFLGSPVLAHSKNNGALQKRYILDYMKPDFIESHGYWVHRYCKSVLGTGQFENMYEQVGGQTDMRDYCSDLPDPGNTAQFIWKRKAIRKSSESKERDLIDALQADLSMEVIKNAIDDCRGDRGDGSNCFYIARTVYRFIPALRKKGILSQVRDYFSYAPSRALLRMWDDPDAYRELIDVVERKIYQVPQRDPRADASKSGLEGNDVPFNVYYDDEKLRFVKLDCSSQDTEKRFFVHVYYEDKDEFVNRDFRFEKNGIMRRDGSCVAVRKILGDPKKISMGQYTVRIDQSGEKHFDNPWKRVINIE